MVTVSEGEAVIPGLQEHLAADQSISTARCPAVSSSVAAMCRHLAPCVLVADAAFVDTLDLERFSAEVDIGNSVKALVVVDTEDFNRCREWLRQGFAGVLPRTAPAGVFGRALRSVADGELWAPRKMISGLVREWVNESSPRQLTGRESEILRLIAGGFTNREIAESLFITRETVRWHVRSIYAKLGASDRESAIRYAVSTGNVPAHKPATRIEAARAGRKTAS